MKILEVVSPVRLPRRSSKFGVGKQIGHHVYMHKMYQDVLPPDILSSAVEVKGDFPYNIIKYDAKTHNVTFVQSPDWDTNPEPVVGKQLLVKPDGSVREMRPSSDPWIYHHKWLFVGDDYPGFDVEESKQRSMDWMSLGDIDYARIGKQSFWEKNVLPRLN